MLLDLLRYQWFRAIGLALAVVVLSYLPYRMITIQWGYYPMSIGQFFDSERARLRMYPSGISRAQLWMEQTLDPSARVLVFRPSDFGFYVSAEMANYLDPRYLDLFEASSVEELHDRLIDHQIDYLYMPNYALPEIYNTPMAALVGDPSRASTVFFDDGVHVLRVNADPAPFRMQTVRAWASADIARSWTTFDSKRGFGSVGRSGDLGSGFLLDRPYETISFRGRRKMVQLYSDRGYWGDPPSTSGDSALMAPGREYMLRYTYSGHGLASWSVMQYDRDGALRTVTPIAQEVLAADNGARSSVARFVSNDREVAEFRVSLSVIEGSQFELQEVALLELDGGPPDVGERSAYLEAGWKPGLYPDGGGDFHHNWGVEQGIPFLRQNGSATEYLVTPVYEAPTVPRAVRVSLSGKGNVDVMMNWNCSKKGCERRLVHLATLLMDDAAQDFEIDLTKLGFQAGSGPQDFPSEDPRMSFFSEDFDGRIQLVFAVRKRPIFRFTRHLHADVNVHSIALLMGSGDGAGVKVHGD